MAIIHNYRHSTAAARSALPLLLAIILTTLAGQSVAAEGGDKGTPSAAASSYGARVKSLANSSNYLAALAAQYIDCWPASRIPIKIYVHPAAKVAGYKPYCLDILKSALSQWSEASDGKITFNIVDKLPDDGIEMTWKPSFVTANHAQEGVAQIFSDHEGIKSATVEVFTLPCDVDDRHAACVVLVGCLHEIGHCLGIQGHSPVGTDMMCPYYLLAHDITPDKIKLTIRDKSTLLAILSLGPKRDPMAAGGPRAICAELNNGAVKDINKGDFQSAIEKLEKCMATDPGYMRALDNLEVCYTNYALQMYQQKRYAETVDLLAKRLDCLDKQTKPDKAKLSETLTVYIFCLKKLGKDAEAQTAQERLNAIAGAQPK
jgi:hypothetical protein